MVLSDNMRGALLMMGSMTAFTINDACMKAASDAVPLFQAIFLRGVGVVFCLLVLNRLRGRISLDLPRADLKLITLRTGAEIAAAYLFITALFHMPIANVTAILQALPLTVTLAGALFLGEAVGWRRMLAILVGFCGVLLIVRPGGEGFNTYSLYVLGAVACVTVRDLAARRMSAAVPSLLVALAAAMGVTLASGLAALFIDWRPLGQVEVAQLGGAMVFVIIGYICSVSAMRVGEIGVVAPFRYTSLVVALVLGLAVFGDWPQPLTLLGAGLIVGTGLFTLARERHQRRRDARRAALATGDAGPVPLRIR